MLPASHPTLVEQLNNEIDKYKLTHLRDELLAAAKPCIVLFEKFPNLTVGQMEEMRAADPSIPRNWEEYMSDILPLGGSRLGGTPDLPDSISWPTHNGKKIPFIAQVDLGSTPDYEGKPVPNDGWLYVFAGGDGFPMASALLHHSGPHEELKRAQIPAENETVLDWMGKGAYYNLLPIERAEIGTSIAIDSELPQDGNLSFEDEDQIYELSSSLALIENDGACAQIGGHVNFPDAAPSEIATIGGPEGDWKLLMEIHSVGSMVWSDCGLLTVFSRRSDLKHSDLSSPYTAIYSS